MNAFKTPILFKLYVFSALFGSFNYTDGRHAPGHENHTHEERSHVSRFHQWADTLANTFIEYFIPLKKSIEQQWSLIYRLILAFLAGFIVSLTPCIYPLVPVTAGVLRLQAGRSKAYNFLFSLVYVLGLALTFSLLGTIAASFGIVFGEWLNNPLFVGIIIAFFLYLSFSLFGFYNLYIPEFLQRKKEVQIQVGGSLWYAFIIGLWSGFIASPCATPALSLMIAYVATTNSIWQGFLLLFFYTFGFCLLLIAVGTFSGLISHLPQPGVWMIATERLLGFLMLILCAYILEPLVANFIANFLYILILAIATIYYVLFFASYIHKKHLQR